MHRWKLHSSKTYRAVDCDGLMCLQPRGAKQFNVSLHVIKYLWLRCCHYSYSETKCVCVIIALHMRTVSELKRDSVHMAITNYASLRTSGMRVAAATCFGSGRSQPPRQQQQPPTMTTAPISSLVSRLRLLT